MWEVAGAEDGVPMPYMEKHRIFDNLGMNHIHDSRIAAIFQHENIFWNAQRDVICLLD
jgi:hypothetical protein